MGGDDGRHGFAVEEGAAEGLAAFALVFAGCGAIVADAQYGGALGVVGIGLVFGLVIMVMIYATGHLSGAHINPAVTIAFTLTRHFPGRDAVAYIAAQLIGAAAAAFLLLAVWPDQPADARGDRAQRRGRERARLRADADRLPDVRDHLRRYRHARGRRGGGDRDRRYRGPRCTLRRSGHRRIDEPGALVRPGARVRRVDTTSGSTSSARCSAPRSAPSPTRRSGGRDEPSRGDHRHPRQHAGARGGARADRRARRRRASTAVATWSATRRGRTRSAG